MYTHFHMHTQAKPRQDVRYINFIQVLEFMSESEQPLASSAFQSLASNVVAAVAR
jgi:hypothetical protein